MKKYTTKTLSVFLAFIILVSAAVVPSSASYFSMDESAWQSYWESYSKDGSAVYLAPGSDESQMNFAWMGKTDCDAPAVYVKAASDSEYAVFSGVSVATDNDEYSYHVTATGLAAGAEYSYYCEADGIKTAESTFKTLDSNDFSAIFVSDIHVTYSETDETSLMTGAGHVNDVFSAAYDKNNDIALVVSAGDQATGGRLDEYKAVFSSPLVKSVQFALSCGNHDYKAEIYPTVVNNPNVFNSEAISPDKNGGDYWFVKGDVLFLMLNTNWVSSEDHRTFLERAVAANPDVKWRVAVMHHDLYGGHIEHRESENELLRLLFPPLYDEFDIDLVLMGHSHIYSRSHVIYDNKVVEDLTGAKSVTDPNGTVYITSASATRHRGEIGTASDKICVDIEDNMVNTYSIIDFSEDEITFNAYIFGDDAEPCDSFSIIKTSQQGGHNGEPKQEDDFVYFISLIVSIFRNIGFYFEKLFAMMGIEL